MDTKTTYDDVRQRALELKNVTGDALVQQVVDALLALNPPAILYERVKTNYRVNLEVPETVYTLLYEHGDAFREKVCFRLRSCLDAKWVSSVMNVHYDSDDDDGGSDGSDGEEKDTIDTYDDVRRMARKTLYMKQKEAWDLAQKIAESILVANPPEKYLKE